MHAFIFRAQRAMEHRGGPSAKSIEAANTKLREELDDVKKVLVSNLPLQAVKENKSLKGLNYCRIAIFRSNCDFSKQLAEHLPLPSFQLDFSQVLFPELLPIKEVGAVKEEEIRAVLKNRSSDDVRLAENVAKSILSDPMVIAMMVRSERLIHVCIYGHTHTHTYDVHTYMNTYMNTYIY